jgi:hypothetical protein
VNLRQAYALAHPLNNPDDDMAPLREVVPHPTRAGLIMSILSVDR